MQYTSSVVVRSAGCFLMCRAFVIGYLFIWYHLRLYTVGFFICKKVLFYWFQWSNPTYFDWYRCKYMTITRMWINLNCYALNIQNQLTYFENAAYVTFVVLLTRVIISFELNLMVPMSKVHENLKRASNRNAVLDEKFFFRKSLQKGKEI